MSKNRKRYLNQRRKTDKKGQIRDLGQNPVNAKPKDIGKGRKNQPWSWNRKPED